MPQADYLEIGQRIAYVRKVARITQRDFARMIGISPGMLAKIEHGAKSSLDTYVRICDALHLTTDYLLLGKGTCDVNSRIEEALAALYHASCAIKRIQT